MGDPTRDFGLDKGDCLQRFEALKDISTSNSNCSGPIAVRRCYCGYEGPDLPGKDGAIRHLFRGLNPQGVDVSNFQLPSAAERQEDFLARYQRRLPPLGSIGIFNRSPYEGVVGDLHDGFIGAEQVSPRLQQIAAFEDQLQGAGILLCKVYLQISAGEQLKQSAQTPADPAQALEVERRRSPGPSSVSSIPGRVGCHPGPQPPSKRALVCAAGRPQVAAQPAAGQPAGTPV